VKDPSAAGGDCRWRDLLTERGASRAVGVASGKGNYEIARELKLAEGTVKNHVSGAFLASSLRAARSWRHQGLSARS